MRKQAFGVIAVLAAACSLFADEGGKPGWRDAESPLIIAHRGSRHEFDDNAAEGFADSLKAGVRGFETDIRITRDDELVIMHDDNVARTTTGKGNVHDLTAAEVTALTLKKSGCHVPSAKALVEVFRGVKGVLVQFEMKESTAKLGDARGELYCRKLHDLVVSTMEPGTYVFLAGDSVLDTLRTMKRLFPDAPVALGTGRGGLTRKLIADARAEGCVAVAPLLAGTSPELVKEANAQGLMVSLWFTHDYKSYAKAFARGAATATSDFAKELLAKVRAKRRLLCIDPAALGAKDAPYAAANRAALEALRKRYDCAMIDALGGYDAAVAHMGTKGFRADETVFIGPDFGKTGPACIRNAKLDCIEVADAADFPSEVSILLSRRGQQL